MGLFWDEVLVEVHVKTRSINAEDAPGASGGYSQAVEVIGATRTLYVSGQIPVLRDGTVPGEFAGQCRAVWSNIDAQLRASGMTFANIVKVTTFLGDRRFAAENSAIRREYLGEATPALTVIITGIYDEAWFVEIEVIAVA